MNITFKKIAPEKVLFFDIEVARKTASLEPNSREFELYRKKIRNKDTGELPSDEETILDYNKNAGLRMTYTKIVSIGVGYIRNNEVFIKSISGEEEDILKEFFSIMPSFDFVCGMNIISYDLPMCYMNAAKYFDYTEIVPDKFVTSSKKPWELKAVIDLMDVTKGTHYNNMSLDELLHHFELDSSKDDIDGSMVSDIFHTEGVERIDKYVKKDVFANINIFRRLQFKPPYESFTDRNERNVGNASSNVSTNVVENPLARIYETDYLSDGIKESLKKTFSKKRLTKSDKEFIADVLENVYIRTAFMDTDTEDVKEVKKNEIQDFLKSL